MGHEFHLRGPDKKAVTCFYNSLDRKDCAARLRAHRPTDSGVTESACGLILTVRFCGRGLRWSLRMARHRSTLRAIIATAADCRQNFWRSAFTISLTGFRGRTPLKRRHRPSMS